MDSGARHFSKKLFMHVAREFTIPFLCAILAFVFLFLINNVFDDLGDFTSRNAPWQAVMSYFLALLPGNLTNVLPISTLLATSFMTVMLGRNNELCAMRSAGLSLAMCALPVWLVAVVAAIVTFALNESWVQASQEYAETIKLQFSSSKKAKLKVLAVSHQTYLRDWYVHADGSNAFTNVVVRQFDDKGFSQWVITAQRAAKTDNGDWLFEKGTFLQLNAAQKNIRPVSFDSKTLQLEERLEDFADMASAISSVSVKKAMDILLRDNPPPEKVAHKLKTSVWFNLTFPLASIVAALFGFSMTIANQRSDAMKGFAMSVGMLVLFYCVGQVFYAIGKNGWMPPFIAGAFPNLAFFCAGIFNVWRKQ